MHTPLTTPASNGDWFEICAPLPDGGHVQLTIAGRLTPAAVDHVVAHLQLVRAALAPSAPTATSAPVQLNGRAAPIWTRQRQPGDGQEV